MKKNILIVSNGTNSNQLSAWTKTRADFEFSFAGTDEEAIEILHRQRFDIVIAAAGEGIKTSKLQAILSVFDADSIFILYFEPQNKDLDIQIRSALDKRKGERIKRLLIMDSSAGSEAYGLPAFSAN
jgi:hypothetical protein